MTAHRFHVGEVMVVAGSDPEEVADGIAAALASPPPRTTDRIAGWVGDMAAVPVPAALDAFCREMFGAPPEAITP